MAILKEIEPFTNAQKMYLQSMLEGITGFKIQEYREKEVYTFNIDKEIIVCNEIPEIYIINTDNTLENAIPELFNKIRSFKKEKCFGFVKEHEYNITEKKLVLILEYTRWKLVRPSERNLENENKI